MSNSLQHPSVSDNTSTTNDHEPDATSKPRKRDIMKSVFSLAPPVSTLSKQSDHTTVEDDEIHRKYERMRDEDPQELLQRREGAAVVIQRHFRGYRDRKMVKGMKLQRDARWDDLVKQTGEQTYWKGQLDNKNDVKSRWHRAVQAASRLESGEGLYNPPSELTEDIPSEEIPESTKKARRATFWGSLSLPIAKDQNTDKGKGRDENEVLPFQSKALEQQHWLEMIDGKHRYGYNMKYYFRKWKEAETQDNFFRWLDRGEGKDLDLEEMPRERLEKERIMYLSAEQRLNYLVKVDKDGLLRWARNNELVDTAASRWKDAGEGKGIIPEDNSSVNEDEQLPRKDDYTTTTKSPWKARKSRKTGSTPSSYGSASDLSISSDSYSAESDLDDNEDTHYVGLDKADEEKGWLERKKKRLTPGGMRKELLRKTVRRNTWIYVSDMKLNLFVGIKQSGNFQHSSFLAGGKVTSAGIIVVKHGLIKSLNPLSGHYRSSIEHFRAFIGRLENRGVDLSHVKIAKSVLSLWGLSKYAKITKREQNLISTLKRTLHISSEPTEEEKSAELKANAEREEKEHQERMQKVHIAEEESGLNDPQRKGDGEEENDEEELRKVRREVLYGKEREKDM
ncbi:IQ domain-containing calmodulin-binding protein [Kwoniella mangroviensis CBS 10435]|uniref:IQ domain-containing calmodulin-binding protein n=1 Tax=Kwoniella mangroviensis CBS 10435 TaxID=1331196 RepID=A0A1B9IR18_9TREE|nr:IQ domain-containing calmodulin-binding protein [Kwoniella mangroviensis CBS 10435]